MPIGRSATRARLREAPAPGRGRWRLVGTAEPTGPAGVRSVVMARAGHLPGLWGEDGQGRGRTARRAAGPPGAPTLVFETLTDDELGSRAHRTSGAAPAKRLADRPWWPASACRRARGRGSGHRASRGEDRASDRPGTTAPTTASGRHDDTGQLVECAVALHDGGRAQMRPATARCWAEPSGGRRSLPLLHRDGQGIVDPPRPRHGRQPPAQVVSVEAGRRPPAWPRTNASSSATRRAVVAATVRVRRPCPSNQKPSNRRRSSLPRPRPDQAWVYDRSGRAAARSCSSSTTNGGHPPPGRAAAPLHAGRHRSGRPPPAPSRQGRHVPLRHRPPARPPCSPPAGWWRSGAPSLSRTRATNSSVVRCTPGNLAAGRAGAAGRRSSARRSTTGRPRRPRAALARRALPGGLGAVGRARSRTR